MPGPKLAVRLVLNLVCLALYACGGGGGGGGASAPVPTMHLSVASFSAQARHEQPAPIRNAFITVSDRPQATLYYAAFGTTNGIDHVNVGIDSNSQLALTAYYRNPIGMAETTYSDSVTVMVCYDSNCSQPIDGAPFTLQSTYTVTKNATVTFQTTASVEALVTDAVAPTAMVAVDIADAPTSDLHLKLSYSTNDYPNSGAIADTPTGKAYALNFPHPATQGDGTYEASLTVKACGDSICTYQFAGSPQTVSTTYTVSAPLLPAGPRVALAHDVVDAAYSQALDAIVMTSTVPVNAVYVFDPVLGTEKQMALGGAPNALALEPGGAHAAIGHGTTISYLDLSTVGMPSPPVPAVLHLSFAAASLLLDGSGYVHAFPANPYPSNLHAAAVQLATDTETGGGIGYSDISPVYIPSTSSVYAVDWSDDRIGKYDVSAGAPAYVDVFANTRGSCGKLYARVGFVQVITGCGDVLNVSPTAGELGFVERLEYYNSSPTKRIRALSESVAASEIALVRAHRAACGSRDARGTVLPTADCITALVLFQRSALILKAIYYLPDITVSAVDYEQIGEFVFHSNDGTKRYLVSSLRGQADPAQAFYVTTVP